MFKSLATKVTASIDQYHVQETVSNAAQAIVLASYKRLHLLALASGDIESTNSGGALFKDKKFKDQDCPSEVIVLQPPKSELPPLLLIGGMGPLAGLDGFISACQHFQNQRQIILVQACPVPCRTAAIVNQDKKATFDCVVDELASAIFAGLKFTKSNMLDLLVLCNTAHYFLPAVLDSLNNAGLTKGYHLQIHSLISIASQEAKTRGLQRVLLMATRGTLNAKLYDKPMAAHGIDVVKPSDISQNYLDFAIQKGVKALNKNLTLEYSRAFFNAVDIRQLAIDGIVVGCTEVPEIISTVSTLATDEAEMLVSLHTIDPIETFMMLH